MPELPEVETVCRGLDAGLRGRVIVRAEARRPDLRFPLPPDLDARLAGRRIESIGRRAKFILMRLDDGTVVLMHLGMSGRMTLHPPPPPPPPPGPHDHVSLVTDDGTTLYFNDVRRFGMLDLVAADDLAGHPMLAALGPEPLGNEFSGPALATALRGRRTPVKAALLDQRVVAGIGNIYASEALFHAGLSPRRQAYTVQGGRADRLAGAIRDVLRAAIEAGGSSLRDHARPSGELGYFQHRWAVYGREGEPCPACRARGQTWPVRRIVQSGRSTFLCTRCQR